MFTNKRSALFAAFVGATFMIMFFQNMTPVEFSTLNMPPIDENARRDQAQELLGSYYNGSVAQSLEGQKDLNYLVFKKLEGSLSREWKRWIPQITNELISESKKRDMDPIFVLAIIQTESQFNTYAKGTSGEIGLMQILPQTGEWISKKYNIPWTSSNALYDPITNIKVGIAYFALLRTQFESQPHHYVPAYNMGPKNLRKVARDIANEGSNEKDLLNGAYGSKVMRNYRMIYQQLVQRRQLNPQVAEGPRQNPREIR
jgi:soluble lytic murein transglycosylase